MQKITAKTKAIKHAILDMDYIQKDLSVKTGIDLATLNQIINGRKNPRDDDAFLIANALNQSIENIFEVRAV